MNELLINLVSTFGKWRAEQKEARKASQDYRAIKRRIRSMFWHTALEGEEAFRFTPKWDVPFGVRNYPLKIYEQIFTATVGKNRWTKLSTTGWEDDKYIIFIQEKESDI